MVAEALKSRPRGNRGFTLFEAVAVIAVLGILSAAFLTRWKDPGDMTVPIQADRLVRHIAHLQALAMNWNQVLRLDLAGDRYAVRCVNGTGSAPCVTAGDIVIDPATSQPFQILLDDGVVVSGPDVDFDPWGRPVSGGTLLTAAQTVQLDAATSSWIVVISPLTGFATQAKL